MAYDPKDQMLMAVKDREIVGVLTFTRLADRNAIRMKLLYVEMTSRSMGIATMLMDRLKLFCIEEQIDAISSEVHASNMQGHKFMRLSEAAAVSAVYELKA